MMGSPVRLLVVDDDVALAELLADVARDHGHEARCAHDGAAAAAHIDDGGFDLMLCDVRMPDIDGIQLVARAAAGEAPPAVIAMTAFGSVETALRAVRAGASDYLTKPFEPGEMVLRMEMALARRSMALELRSLRRATDRAPLAGMIGQSEPMRALAAMVRKVADTTSTVVVSGPSGSGKELVARALHAESRRRAKPFVAVNCAAIPPTLIEAELFGAKRGAFTDAHSDRRGVFQEADGGTLFLDEIGELPIGVQATLLRALQEREVRPIGANHPVKVDVRVVAATNRDLREALAERTFREDLFYRLAVIEVQVPPLRDRHADILPLAEHFLHRVAAREGKPVAGFAPAAAKALLAQDWPGNVRELQNAVERAVALCAGTHVSVEDLPVPSRGSGPRGWLQGAAEQGMTLPELDRAYARLVLQREGGNKVRAAQRLGVDRRTLQRWFGEGAEE